MRKLRKHLVLIGFKHVGKSVIGKCLAERLHSPFVDLDQQIIERYSKEFAEKYNCRQIMQAKGEAFFRLLEAETLRHILAAKPAVISVGGGSLMHEISERLLKSCLFVHVKAPRGIVYERILMNGRPAFFNEKEDLLVSFNRLWDEREKIYDRLQDFSITNNSSLETAVNCIITKIYPQEMQR